MPISAQMLSSFLERYQETNPRDSLWYYKNFPQPIIEWKSIYQCYQQDPAPNSNNRLPPPLLASLLYSLFLSPHQTEVCVDNFKTYLLTSELKKPQWEKLTVAHVNYFLQILQKSGLIPRKNDPFYFFKKSLFVDLSLEAPPVLVTLCKQLDTDKRSCYGIWVFIQLQKHNETQLGGKLTPLQVESVGKWPFSIRKILNLFKEQNFLLSAEHWNYLAKLPFDRDEEPPSLCWGDHLCAIIIRCVQLKIATLINLNNIIRYAEVLTLKPNKMLLNNLTSEHFILLFEEIRLNEYLQIKSTYTLEAAKDNHYIQAIINEYKIFDSQHFSKP